MTFPEIGALMVLGFVMGFSPTLYGVTLSVLTRTTRPFAAVTSLMIGMAVASTLLLVVFRAVDPDTLIATWQGRVQAVLVQRTVDLIAGVLLVGTGFVVWRIRKRPKKVRKPKVRRNSPRELLLVGFLETLAGVSGLATMYVTGRVISAASPFIGWGALAYCFFLIPLVGPYFGVAYLWERIPALARGVSRGYAWVSRIDFRPLLAVALAVAGVVFFVLAFRA